MIQWRSRRLLPVKFLQNIKHLFVLAAIRDQSFAIVIVLNPRQMAGAESENPSALKISLSFLICTASVAAVEFRAKAML